MKNFHTDLTAKAIIALVKKSFQNKDNFLIHEPFMYQKLKNYLQFQDPVYFKEYVPDENIKTDVFLAYRLSQKQFGYTNFYYSPNYNMFIEYYTYEYIAINEKSFYGLNRTDKNGNIIFEDQF